MRSVVAITVLGLLAFALLLVAMSTAIQMEAVMQYRAESEARAWSDSLQSYRGEASWDGKKWVESDQGSYRP
jgi:hypothetical protein